MAADSEHPEPPAAEANELWSDSGPEFSPEDAPEAPDPGLAEAEAAALGVGGWEPDAVAELLRGQGELTNQLIGVTATNWKHRDKRLDRVAPAIAREMNRVPQLAALSVQTDRAIVLAYLAEYLTTNYIERVGELKRRRAEAEAEPEVPVTGLAAPEGTGPESDTTNYSGGRPVADIPPRRR